MTATIHPWAHSVRQLAGIETRRALRSPVLWLGIALTLLVQLGTTADWSGGAYEERIVGILPLCVAAVIGAARVGGRDSSGELAAAAPLERRHRAVARIMAAGVYPLGAAAIAIGIAVVSRIEGGYWIGEGAYRTDTALHPATELAQLPLLAGLAAVVGVALGARRHRAGWLMMAVAGVLTFFMFGLWWVTNEPPAHVVAPVQVMPLTVDLGPSLSSVDVDPDWLIDGPGEHAGYNGRQVVHQPTIIGHDMYLAGWTAVVAALAVGARSARRLMTTGLIIGTIGIAVQLIWMPSGIT